MSEKGKALRTIYQRRYLHNMSQFFRVKASETGEQVWDPVRKKYVALTPEEKVRHAIIAYLVEHCQYPLALLSVEKKIKVLGQNRRYDIVVYNRSSEPAMLIECKQAEIPILQQTIEQAAQYNLALQVPYLVLSNSQTHFIVKIDFETHSFVWLNSFPDYSAL
jgi:hypothetical protein